MRAPQCSWPVPGNTCSQAWENGPWPMSWSSAATLMWSAVSGEISRSSRRATRCAMWNAPSAWPNRECAAPGYTSQANPICRIRRSRCITRVSSRSAIGRSAPLNSMSPCTGSRNTRSFTPASYQPSAGRRRGDRREHGNSFRDDAPGCAGGAAGRPERYHASVPQIRELAIERLDGDARRADRDRVVVEAPLELRARGTPVATIMRTPGHDLELVRGLLHAESLGPAALAQVGDDTVEVDIASGAFAGRGVLASAACGVCGRVAIADL